MDNYTYEGHTELGFVSNRERVRHDLEIEKGRLSSRLADLDLRNETKGVASLRKQLDAVKRRLASLDATEPADFTCANRLCGAKVDCDDPGVGYSVADVPRIAAFLGREPAAVTTIGLHPALALGFCRECADHIDRIIEMRIAASCA